MSKGKKLSRFLNTFARDAIHVYLQRSQQCLTKHITTQLPRMSSELHLHPMKLKRKFEYKTNYIYYYIHRDVVSAAIRWLKNQDHLYQDITVSDEWERDIQQSEFATSLVSELGDSAIDDLSAVLQSGSMDSESVERSCDDTGYSRQDIGSIRTGDNNSASTETNNLSSTVGEVTTNSYTDDV